ncbi:MAG: hypothetical protein O3C39_04535 [Planctomycetota bacterium]|nr:hypothetical protein [Planctomycetota bacterium]
MAPPIDPATFSGSARSRWVGWLAVVCLAVMPALAITAAAGLVHDVPWGDHLTLFRDTGVLEGISAESLFRFHNEHLIVPTRLAVAADYAIWHGANLLPAIATLIFAIGIVAIEVVMFRRSLPGLPAVGLAFAAALLAAVLLNGRLTWTLTFPILLQHVSANFFVVAALAGYAIAVTGRQDSRRQGWGLCLLAAAGAAVSSAAGVFALPAAAAATMLLAIISPPFRRRPWRGPLAAVILVGAAVIGAYGLAYVASGPAEHVRTATNLAQAIRFTAYFPGGVWFRDGGWPIIHHADPLLLHAVVLGFWAALGLVAADLWRRRESLGEFELFHVAVLAFVLGTATVGGLFRGGLSPLEALNKKYAPTALLAWGSLASLGLRRAGAWLLGEGSAPAARQLAVAAGLLVAILPGDIVEYRAWAVWMRELHQAAASYAAGDRSDALIRRFFENVNMGRRLLAPIAADGGYCFARAEQLAAEARSVPAAGLTESGRLERVPDHTDYSLESINDQSFPLGKPPPRIAREAPLTVAGWAVDREAGRPAAGVELVVGDRGFEVRYGLPRPDVAEYFKQPGLADSGFRGILPAGTLPPGEHTLRLRLRMCAGEHFLETPGYPVIVE